MIYKCDGCDSNFDSTEQDAYQLSISLRSTFGYQMIGPNDEWLSETKVYCESCYNSTALPKFKELIEVL